MKIKDIINVLETLAAPVLQESYDNSGLITGTPETECTGIICCLDTIEAVIEEAVSKGCNMVVAHHPIIFKGLKRITGSNYVERTIIKAIKHDIAVYAIHTNLDNVINGVSGMMAQKLGLQHTLPLLPQAGKLKKLFSFAPKADAEKVRAAIFKAGAGHIGNYSECSFNAEGTGTFKAGADSKPYIGNVGVRHEEQEVKIEVIFPQWLQASIIKSLLQSHPYEEVAYDIVSLDNVYDKIGSGIIGDLAAPVSESAFLATLKDQFNLTVIRHTAFTGKAIQKVALCGGAGSFLITNALRKSADVYITADVKYHEFFDADGKMLLADIGHFESEQFTITLLYDILREKFPTFAVLKTAVNTNPVFYYA